MDYDRESVVPQSAIVYEEIFRRGGANCGDEDFALTKCPVCARIFLVEYEADTLYLDPENLECRMALDIGSASFVATGFQRKPPGLVQVLLLQCRLPGVIC